MRLRRRNRVCCSLRRRPQGVGLTLASFPGPDKNTLLNKVLNTLKYVAFTTCLNESLTCPLVGNVRGGNATS